MVTEAPRKVANIVFSGISGVSRKLKLYVILGVVGVAFAYGVGNSLPKAYFQYKLKQNYEQQK